MHRGLVGVVILRWVLFSYDVRQYQKMPYSEEEMLDPRKAESEGMHVDFKLPKNKGKPLSVRECQGMTTEQLDELDAMGYTLPDSVKEQVMDYREVYKVYRKPYKTANYWNYNQMYNEEDNPNEEQPQEAPKTAKKKKTLKEVADEVKRDIVSNTNPSIEDDNVNLEGKPKVKKRRNIFREDNDHAKTEKIKEGPDFKVEEHDDTKGAAEIKIPRMRANLYNLEKTT